MDGIQIAAWRFFADKPVTDTPPTQANWPMVAVFGLLALAVVGLGYALVKQVRRVQREAESGTYSGKASDRIS